MVMSKNIFAFYFFLILFVIVFDLTIGHGRLISPNVNVETGPLINEEISKLGKGFKKEYGQHPSWDTKSFTHDFKNSEYRGDLKALFTAKKIGSPGPNINSKPQRISELKTKDAIWWRDTNPSVNGKVGFTVDHHGPCAIYIDDKMVFHEDDCTQKHRESPARMPVDLQRHCKGECTLEFYWLAFVFTPNVQYYQNSAKLIGNGKKEVGTDTKKTEGKTKTGTEEKPNEEKNSTSPMPVTATKKPAVLPTADPLTTSKQSKKCIRKSKA